MAGVHLSGWLQPFFFRYILAYVKHGFVTHPCLCYRCILIAVVGWLSLAAQHPNPAAKTQQSDATQAQANAATNIAARDYEAAERAHRAKYEAECDPRNEKRNSDLCAQWKAADAAADAARWTAWGTWAAAVSTVLVLIALGLAFQSNRIARDTAKRQLRAYISIKEARCCRIIPGRTQEGSLKLTNTGQTPARKFRVVSALVVRPPDWDSSKESVDFEGCGVSYVGAGTYYEVEGVTDEPLDEGEFVEIGLGRKRLYLLIVGEFEDIFAKRHTFRFALENALPIDSGRFRPCSHGNDAT